MRRAVLMFHALYDGEAERRALSAEEAPYALSTAEFERTLDLIEARGGTMSPASESSASDTRRVLLSFDDGHASNYRHAFPLLCERGISGLFFVTTDFVERRSRYCRWAWLTEMAAAGMRIQSHGVSHRFLDDLEERQAREELSDSKRIIEDRTGRPVDSISFPGGRYGRRELRLARLAGYRHCFTSRFGGHRRPGLPFVVRRIAVRAGMKPEQTAALAIGDTWPSLRRHAVDAVKSGGRRMLGNRIYHALYRKWAER